MTTEGNAARIALAAYHAASRTASEECNAAWKAASQRSDQEMQCVYATMSGEALTQAMLQADRRHDTTLRRANKAYDTAMMAAHEKLISDTMKVEASR